MNKQKLLVELSRRRAFSKALANKEGRFKLGGAAGIATGMNIGMGVMGSPLNAAVGAGSLAVTGALKGADIISKYRKYRKQVSEARVRKTEDEWQLHTNYGHGWEHEVSENSRKEIMQRVKEYRENSPGTRLKVVFKRVKKPLQEEIEMKKIIHEEAENLIQAVVDQKPVDAKASFDAMITDKLADMLDVYKAHYTAAKFEGEDDEAPQEDETQEDEKDAKPESEEGDGDNSDNGGGGDEDDNGETEELTLTDEDIENLLGGLSDEELEALLKDMGGEGDEPEPDATEHEPDETELAEGPRLRAAFKTAKEFSPYLAAATGLGAAAAGPGGAAFAGGLLTALARKDLKKDYKRNLYGDDIKEQITQVDGPIARYFAARAKAKLDATKKPPKAPDSDNTETTKLPSMGPADYAKEAARRHAKAKQTRSLRKIFNQPSGRRPIIPEEVEELDEKAKTKKYKYVSGFVPTNKGVSLKKNSIDLRDQARKYAEWKKIKDTKGKAAADAMLEGIEDYDDGKETSAERVRKATRPTWAEIKKMKKKKCEEKK